MGNKMWYRELKMLREVFFFKKIIRNVLFSVFFFVFLWDSYVFRLNIFCLKSFCFYVVLYSDNNDELKINILKFDSFLI